MQLKKGQIIEIRIENLAFGGAGVGRFFGDDLNSDLKENPSLRAREPSDSGLAVFVKKTMPGDLVRASFTKIKKNYAEAKLEEIVEPSSERIEPKCKYFGICGGCQFQFMPYRKQLELKKQQIIDAFERIGGFENPKVEEILPSENQYYYRNKMEFSFGYDAEMKFTLGLHLPGRRYDILDLKECHLQSKFSYKLVNFVRDFFKNLIEKSDIKGDLSNSWLPYQFSCGVGFLRSLFIREGKNTDEIMIILETSEKVPPDANKVFEDFKENLLKFNKEYEGNLENKDSKNIVSIYWKKITSKRGQKKKIETKLLHGKESFLEILKIENGENERNGDYGNKESESAENLTSQMKFEVLPQAFFQVNTQQAEVLYGEVLKFAKKSLKSSKIILDLFCGTGTIGLFLAKNSPDSRVIGVELNEEAIKIAQKNAELNKIRNIEFYNDNVEKFLEKLDFEDSNKETKILKPDLIVIDPPRPGLTPKMIQLVQKFETKNLIYVSCNPATLARDCKIFHENGYEIQKIQPVDMFPQTFHIENVCLFHKSEKVVN